MKGKLYLIPVPLGSDGVQTIPDYVLVQIRRLRVFITERGKTARQFLKAVETPIPLPEMEFYELNKHTDPAEVAGFLAAAERGTDIGMLSEAGCPGVADPGAQVARLAHDRGIQVVPLVGPSSILLALMASGLDGQSFAFNGYLSPKPGGLNRELRQLEQRALKHQQTQIFMETPYRNNKMLDVVMKTLQPQTRFCVAANLTQPDEFVRTKTIQDWWLQPPPDLHKIPAMFLIGK